MTTNRCHGLHQKTVDAVFDIAFGVIIASPLADSTRVASSDTATLVACRARGSICLFRGCCSKRSAPCMCSILCLKPCLPPRQSDSHTFHHLCGPARQSGILCCSDQSDGSYSILYSSLCPCQFSEPLNHGTYLVLGDVSLHCLICPFFSRSQFLHQVRCWTGITLLHHRHQHTVIQQLMMAVRKSEHILNDLPQNTPAFPHNVSDMIDFRAKIFACASTFLAYFISNSTTSCSHFCILWCPRSCGCQSTLWLASHVTRECASDLSTPILGSNSLIMCTTFENLIMQSCTLVCQDLSFVA